jgi:hypothetical protein
MPMLGFAGFYGFKRVGRPPLPSLDLVGVPIHAHFRRIDASNPIRAINHVAAEFVDADAASRAGGDPL